MKFLIVAVAMAALVQGEIAMPLHRHAILRGIPVAHFGAEALEGPAAGAAYTIVDSAIPAAVRLAAAHAAPETTILAEAPLKAAHLTAYEVADEAAAEAEAEIEAAIASSAASSFAKSSPWARLAAYGLAPKKAFNAAWTSSPIAVKSAAYESAIPAGSYLVSSGFAPEAAAGFVKKAPAPATWARLAALGFAPKSAAAAHFAAVPVKAARLAASGFAPEAFIVSDASVAPKSTAGFAAEAAIAKKAARLAALGVAPKTAVLTAARLVAEESAMPAISMKAARMASLGFAPESSVAMKAARLAALGVAPETAFLAATMPGSAPAVSTVARMASPISGYGAFAPAAASPAWAAEGELAADEAEVAMVPVATYGSY